MELFLGVFNDLFLFSKEGSGRKKPHISMTLPEDRPRNLRTKLIMFSTSQESESETAWVRTLFAGKQQQLATVILPPVLTFEEDLLWLEDVLMMTKYEPSTSAEFPPAIGSIPDQHLISKTEVKRGMAPRFLDDAGGNVGQKVDTIYNWCNAKEFVDVRLIVELLRALNEKTLAAADAIKNKRDDGIANDDDDHDDLDLEPLCDLVLVYLPTLRHCNDLRELLEAAEGRKGLAWATPSVLHANSTWEDYHTVTDLLPQAGMMQVMN